MSMPESRDRLVRRDSTGEVQSLADLRVFAIHRDLVNSFTVAERRRRIGNGRNLFGNLTDDKENIPPESSRSSRYLAGRRRSPLPDWYPRTPLRDITYIVQALERRRIRLREEALRRRNQEGNTSSPVPSINSPATPELNDSEQPQGIRDALPETQVEAEDVPDNNPTTNNINLATGKIAPEKKCLNPVDEIERVAALAKLRLPEKPAKKTQRSTLMTMR